MPIGLRGQVDSRDLFLFALLEGTPSILKNLPFFFNMKLLGETLVKKPLIRIVVIRSSFFVYLPAR